MAAIGTRSVVGSSPIVRKNCGGRPDQPGREVDAPDADAGRLLGQRQRLVTEGVVGQPVDERVARLCRGEPRRGQTGVRAVFLMSLDRTVRRRFGYHEILLAFAHRSGRGLRATATHRRT